MGIVQTRFRRVFELCNHWLQKPNSPIMALARKYTSRPLLESRRRAVRHSQRSSCSEVSSRISTIGASGPHSGVGTVSVLGLKGRLKMASLALVMCVVASGPS